MREKGILDTGQGEKLNKTDVRKKPCENDRKISNLSLMTCGEQKLQGVLTQNRSLLCTIYK